MTIDQATADNAVGGSEFLPASEGGTPKKVSTAQIADYVLGLLKASGVENFSTSGTVSWKNSDGALKFASGAQFARAIIAWAFAQAAVTNVEGMPSLAATDTFIVKQGDEEHVMSLAQLTTYLANQITATIELHGMASADALSGADLFLVAQGTDDAQTNKNVALSTVRSFILNGIGAYLKDNSTLVSASGDTEQGPEFVFSYKGTTLRKWRLSSMIALAGDVHGPSSTTSGKVPQWSSMQKTLTDGLDVSTSIGANSTDAQLPTAKAAKDYADNTIGARFPNASTAGNVPTYTGTDGKLGAGKAVVTAVGNTSVASDGNIPTEKAVRDAIQTERTYVDDNLKINVGTHSQGDLAKFATDGRSIQGGPTVTTEVSSTAVTASDSKLPTEKAVRTAIANAMGQGIAGMAAATTVRSSTYADDNHVPTEHAVAAALDTVVKTGLHADGEIPRFDGAGAQLKGGTALVTEVRAASNASDAAIATEKAVRTAVNVVQTALDNKKLDALAIPDAGTALDATSSCHGLMSAADKDKLDQLENTENAEDLSGDIADGDLVVLRDVSLQVAKKTRKTTFEKVWDFIKAHILAAIHIDDLLACQDISNGNASTSAHGLLPKLLETHAGKFLRADGQWVQPAGSTDFVGAQNDAAGASGLVPAPALGVTGKFLKSNGEWADVPIPVGAENIAFDNISDAPAINDNAKVLTFDGSNYYLLKIGDFAFRYDTLWVPAGAMAPASLNAAVADSVIASGNGTIRDAMRFGYVSDRFAHFNIVLPDNFDEDSAIKAKVFWTPGSGGSGNHWVRFTLAALASADGGDLSLDLGSATDFYDQQAVSASAATLHVTDAATIAPAGQVLPGRCVHFRLGRILDTAAHGTSLAADAYVLGVLFQLRRKATGQEAW